MNNKTITKQLIEKIDNYIENDYKTEKVFENFFFENLKDNVGFMIFSEKSKENENIRLKFGKYPYKRRYYYVEKFDNDTNKKNVVFVLFNCSTSSPEEYDDTIKNCRTLTENKYNRIEVINLFSIRKSSLKDITKAELEQDVENYDFISELLNKRNGCDIILAWGYGKENLSNKLDSVKDKGKIIKDRIKKLKDSIKHNKIANLKKISVDIDKAKEYIVSKDRHPGNQAWSSFGKFEDVAKITDYSL